MRPLISVVVPVYNEEASVPPLVEAVRSALSGYARWELILIDDGSSDDTFARVREAARQDGRVRPIRLARNYGQTPAMQAGFDAARGEVVVTMDGDLQNDPRDIPLLLDRLDEGYDLVAGYRVNRQDKAITRKLPSWVANRLIRAITRVDIRDNGCSLKAYRADLLRRLHLYSDMHRFIPAIAAGTAGARIAEVPVRHHARQHGTSKYGLGRIGKVLADLFTVLMIRSFRSRPLLMFALGSIATLGVGLLFLAASVFAQPAEGGAGRVVLPTAALLWCFLSTYLLFLGLISEAAVVEIGGAEDEGVLIRELE